jgi:excisionase family DNA binding protein
MANDYLTVRQAAQELGYHPDHVRRLLRAGTLQGKHFGIVWMIPRAEVERIRDLQLKSGRLPPSKEP